MVYCWQIFIYALKDKRVFRCQFSVVQSMKGCATDKPEVCLHKEMITRSIIYYSVRSRLVHLKWSDMLHFYHKSEVFYIPAYVTPLNRVKVFVRTSCAEIAFVWWCIMWNGAVPAVLWGLSVPFAEGNTLKLRGCFVLFRFLQFTVEWKTFII